jgi:glycosyltransferase involved in cell wall biosynthesis
VVTIGIPVYNGSNFLSHALDSILEQTYSDFEVIVSDNASTDPTQELVLDYAARDARIRYFRNDENIGAARNYNRTFALASGGYFKWFAHDDVLAPNYLARCVEVLDREAEVVLSFPRFAYIDEHGDVLAEPPGDLSLRSDDVAARVRMLVQHELEDSHIFWAVFGLARTDVLRKTRLIDSHVASDQTLLIELALLGKFAQIPDPLFFRREHPLSSMKSQRTPKLRAEWFDPEMARQKRVIWPHWTLFGNHLAAVTRTHLPPSTKARCYYHVVRRFAHEWRTLAGEFKLVAHQLRGDHQPLAGKPPSG